LDERGDADDQSSSCKREREKKLPRSAMAERERWADGSRAGHRVGTRMATAAARG
jgi:hypothetical protein